MQQFRAVIRECSKDCRAKRVLFRPHSWAMSAKARFISRFSGTNQFVCSFEIRARTTGVLGLVRLYQSQLSVTSDHSRAELYNLRWLHGPMGPEMWRVFINMSHAS